MWWHVGDLKIRLLLSWAFMVLAIVSGSLGSHLMLSLLGVIAVIIRQSVPLLDETPTEILMKSSFLKSFTVIYLMCVSLYFVANAEDILDLGFVTIFLAVAFPFIVIIVRYELVVYEKLLK